VNEEITRRYFSLSEWQRVLLAMRDQMHLQVATILSLSLLSQSKSQPTLMGMKKHSLQSVMFSVHIHSAPRGVTSVQNNFQRNSNSCYALLSAYQHGVQVLTASSLQQRMGCKSFIQQRLLMVS